MRPGAESDDFELLAPLVAGPVSWSNDGEAGLRVSIDAGDRVVDVEGELVASVLSDCDGRNTVAGICERHGDAAHELLAELFAAGAVLDAVDAWQVFHRQSSAGSAIGRGASAAEIAALQERFFTPAGIDGDGVALANSTGNLAALTGARRSMTPDTPFAQPDFEQLSSLMTAVYSVSPGDGSGDAKTGANASAGALYPLIAHVYLRESVGPLEPGLWWHDPVGLREHRIAETPGDVGEVFLREPNCDMLLQRGGPILFLSADLTSPARKYGARGYRYALLEAGAAMQSASLAAAEAGLPLRVIGGIDDEFAKRFLDLPERAVCLLALIVG